MDSPATIIIAGEARRPALLDAKQCAAILAISPRSWLRLVARGEAPAPVKLGRLTRWRAADLDAYVAQLPAVQRAA